MGLIIIGVLSQGRFDEPVGVETYFGWILNGPADSSNGVSSRVHFASCTSAHTMVTIDYPRMDNEDNFWNLETIGVKENELSNYEKYENLISINSEGRYETKLPFKESHELLNDNYEICEKRLLNLHKKLKNDPELMKKYDLVFKEQKDMGIIEEASEPTTPGEVHYIPHHPVIKENRATTKLRIVFDASAKTDGPSLNDCLYKGPQMTPLLYDILLRFRTFVYALTADIEKAFHQISIDKDHRNFLRFLWFDDVFSDQPTIVRNRFARVIFGVTSSPFLLTGVIRKHAEQYDFDHEFVEKVINSFYADDFSGGANTLDDVYEFFKKLKLLFIEGAFHLRKWRTNEPNLQKLIGDENLSSSKILGIIWNEKNDTLSFQFQEICNLAQNLKPTKRNILKILSMFYDPIGILQPVIINLKIIFQNVCKRKLLWDDELPIDIANDWKNAIYSLNELQEINIPRKIIFQEKTDASQKLPP